MASSRACEQARRTGAVSALHAGRHVPRDLLGKQPHRGTKSLGRFRCTPNRDDSKEDVPNLDGSGPTSGDECTITTDELPTLDVRRLKREGFIATGQEQLKGVARLEWTPCNFGGERPWFVCPGEGCARRVAILYGPGPGRLLCRRCRDLTYESQWEDQIARAKRRVEKARSRLPPSGARPKGMHHSTFLKLTQDYLDASKEHEAFVQERLARLAWRRTVRRLRSLRRRRAS